MKNALKRARNIVSLMYSQDHGASHSPTPSFFRRHSGWLLPSGLLGLLLFHGINNWHIMTRTTEMILNDQMSYFSFMLQVVSSVREGAWHTLFFEQIPQVWKPPLYMLASAPLLLVQRSIEMAAMANIIFLGITMLCIYGVGKEMYGRTAGAAAAFIFSMIPNVFAMSRIFYLETALTAMVALTFWLFSAGRFRSLPVAAATGVVMGLGMLTKQPYALFVLPFFLYFALPEDRSEVPVRPSRAAAAVCIAVLVASIWYLQKDRLTLDYYRWYVSNEYTSPDALFYLKALFTRQLFPVFFVFFVFSLLYAVRRKKYFVPAYCVLALVFFSLVNNRGDRYILPLFPFMALLMGGALAGLAKERKTVYVLAAAFCFFQYWLVSYQPQYLFRVFPRLEGGFPYNTISNGGIFAVSPRQDDWKGAVSRLLAGLDRYAPDRSRPLSLTDISVVGCELEYQVVTQGHNFRLAYPCRGLERGRRPERELRRESGSTLDRTDVMVRSVPALPLFFYWDLWPYLDEAFARVSNDFTLVAQVPCPQGNTLQAYVRTRHLAAAEKAGAR